MPVSRALDFLRACQNPDGGWGYKPGGMSFVEPTSAVILALYSDAQSNGQVQRARAFLASLQHDDGGWGIAALDDESGWMTAWAVMALTSTDAEPAQRGVKWLLDSAGVRITDPTEIERVRNVLKIDATITGWSWQPGDAAWIFPTALSLLALHRMHVGEHPRVREGIQYLLDRAIATGGWNIGNPFMVTGTLPPTVENTSLALLALRAFEIENEITQRARDYLAQENFASTAFEWAWRAWCWNGSDALRARALKSLESLQRPDGSWDGNPFTTAIASIRS